MIAHALSSFVTTLRQPQLAVAMSLVIPALLSRANKEGKESYHETSARLLELAGADQGAFRTIVASMNRGQKAFIEEVIKSGQASATQKRADTGGNNEPTIALRMDFGGA